VFLNPTWYRHGPRPGSRVLTGLTLIFFINQNDVILVKNKKNSYQLQSGFLLDFYLPLFFYKPSPVPAPGSGSTRQSGPGVKTIPRTSFMGPLL